MSNPEAPHITTMGGGSGSSNLLAELKFLTPNISAIVNMYDDGGSTGKLMKERGVCALGDLRKCSTALSNDDELAEYYESRNEYGHAEGNLKLADLLQEETGDIKEAVARFGQLLNITGQVLPVTTQKHILVLRDGKTTYRGEENIGDIREFNVSSPHISLEPEATLDSDARDAMYSADIIAATPANLYRSQLPVAATKGVYGTFQYTPQVQKVLIANLTSPPGQKEGWHVVDQIKEFEKYTGKGSIDTVIFNTDLPSREFQEKLGRYEGPPLDIAKDRFFEIQAATIGAAILSHTVATPSASDILYKGERPRLRHDGAKVAKMLIELTKPF